MSKGDLVLVPFPFTDLSGQKVRPALILYAERKGEDCIVAFLSSVKNKKIYPFDFVIKPSKRNGLKMNSVVKINKIATLEKRIVLGQLGTLESVELNKIDAKLKLLFGL
ncbi:MAG: type II toxin-antitoxin system PemK/MazF family toxin [bacterium]|nr:type II toxin-antitoxin system PemK/MazF family toxin [bacterium]